MLAKYRFLCASHSLILSSSSERLSSAVILLEAVDDVSHENDFLVDLDQVGTL